MTIALAATSIRLLAEKSAHGREATDGQTDAALARTILLTTQGHVNVTDNAFLITSRIFHIFMFRTVIRHLYCTLVYVNCIYICPLVALAISITIIE